MSVVKRLTFIVWLIGLAVTAGLIIWSGAGTVGQAMAATGWAVVLVVIIRATGVAGAGVGWWLLFPRDIRPSLLLCVLIRNIREAANALLPLGQIGGDFIGARCLALRGTKGTIAAASVIIDVLMQASTQLAFAMVGLIALMVRGGSEPVVGPIAIGIAVAIPALGGFSFVQSGRGQQLLKKLLSMFAGDREWLVFGKIDDLYARLADFYAYRAGLVRSFLWHFADWFVGVAEVFVVLSFMGYPVTLVEAVIIESLIQAVRGAAFAIPGAIGAQEGGLVLLCSLFGVPPQAALALSLVKRIPDLVLGIPGMLAWQTIEGWHFYGARRRQNRNERA
jgi:putative membrane protein